MDGGTEQLTDVKQN